LRLYRLVAGLEVILIAAAVLSAGGCGGGSSPRLTKAEYRAQELRFEDEYLVADRLYLRFTAERISKRECVKAVRLYHRDVDRIVTEAEALRPPAEVADLHRKLLGAARGVVREIGQAADDVAAGRLACGQPVNRRIYGAYSASPIDAIMASLERRGHLFSGE
jgi:hypothetical protein